MYVDVRGSGLSFLFFFFIDPAPTEIYTLPLHDALPIFQRRALARATEVRLAAAAVRIAERVSAARAVAASHRHDHRVAAPHPLSDGVQGSVATDRSEEHTSELQSQSNLVCRLLLAKQNI